MSSILKREDGSMIVTVRISLRPGRDDALIDLVLNAPHYKLAACVREAMRNGASITNINYTDDEMDLSELGNEI